VKEKNTVTLSGFIRNSFGRTILLTCLWSSFALMIPILAMDIASYSPPSDEGIKLPLGRVRFSDYDWVCITIVFPAIVTWVGGALVGALLSPMLFFAARCKSLWFVFLLVTLIYIPGTWIALTIHIRFGGTYRYYLVVACVACSLLLGAVLARKLPNRVRPGYCRTCGYNLTGNTSGICPECGAKAGGEKHRNRWET
jgi:hypothetical protein